MLPYTTLDYNSVVWWINPHRDQQGYRRFKTDNCGNLGWEHVVGYMEFLQPNPNLLIHT